MKVCFVYPSWSNEKTLEAYRKMTPNRSGVWKDMVGVNSVHDADYCIIIDYTEQRIPTDKAIYVSAHPKMEGFTGYHDLSKHRLKLDAADTFGFGEWWLDYDYDYLSALEPPEKTKEVCCIMSNTDGDFGRTQRKKFIKGLKYPINLYGRIDGSLGSLGSGEHYGGNHMHGKEDVLREHKFSIEIDVGKTENYFSERVFDSLLMWCKPLYWGSTNVEKYLPVDCFSYVDINGKGEDILQAIKTPIDYEAISDARDLLLNKYQIWARVYEFISNNSLL